MLRPLGDRVVVKQRQPEQKTSTGILLTAGATDKPSKGLVLAVGDGAYQHGSLLPMNVKVGDVVVFGKFTGTPVMFEDEELLIMSQSEILAIIEE